MSERDLHVYFCDGTVPALARGWYWRRQRFLPGMYGSPHGPFESESEARAAARSEDDNARTDVGRGLCRRERGAARYHNE